MDCHFCHIEHRTRIEFMLGGKCSKCGAFNPIPIAVYTHDSVDDDEKYWHHFTFEGQARCSSCGHTANDTKKLCRDLNTLSAELSKPEAAFA